MFTNDYVVGLVDGEGSFTVYVRDLNQPKKVQRRVKAEPRFYLKLIEKDKLILDQLKEFFGCGNVYFQKDQRKNHQNCHRFEVTKREDLKNVIIPFFRKNPLRFPSKLKDFEIFSKIMKKIDKGEHLTAGGLNKLFKLKQQMH